MFLYPDGYFESIRDIKIEYLKENKIKAVILDVDNTLIDYYKNLQEGTKEWVNEAKRNGIKFCILSNSNKLEKVKKVAEEIDVPYFYFAKKPLKGGFKKAKKILKVEEKYIAVVGDQIMTDVLGANRCKMFSILVKPIMEKDIIITKIKRPIENFIIKNYQNKLKRGENENVHK